jgi:predicted Zn-dependent peptidase
MEIIVDPPKQEETPTETPVETPVETPSQPVETPVEQPSGPTYVCSCGYHTTDYSDLKSHLFNHMQNGDTVNYTVK